MGRTRRFCLGLATERWDDLAAAHEVCAARPASSTKRGASIALENGGGERVVGLAPSAGSRRRSAGRYGQKGKGPATLFHGTVAPSRAWRGSRFQVDGATRQPNR